MAFDEVECDQLAEIDGEVASAWKAYYNANDHLKKVIKQRAKFLAKAFKGCNVHELDDSTLKMVFMEGRNESWAYDLMNEWFGERYSEVSYGGAWCSIGDTDVTYPYAQICLTKNQKVTTAAKKLERIATRLMTIFNLTEIQISVFERSLSEHGFYIVIYRSRDDVELQHLFHSSPTTLCKGTVTEILTEISRSLWYNE